MGKREVRRWIETCLDRVYPPASCYACGNEIFDSGRNNLCRDCCEKLETVPNPKTYEEIGTFSYCRYNDFSRNIILRAKDGDEPFLLRPIALFLADVMKENGIGADVLAFVPSMKKTVRRRGYDHMKRIATILSRETDIPILKGCRRIAFHADQTALRDRERFENVRNDFVYNGEDLTGKTVLLIDDIITTGATLNACYGALQKANPRAVIGLTFARAHNREEKECVPSKTF